MRGITDQQITVDAVLDRTLGEVEQTDGQSETLHLGNGAILRLTPPPSMALQMFQQNHAAPKPPVVRVEADGRSWEEENPNDPGYIAAMEEHNMQAGEALIRLMLWTSCEIVRLPTGVPSYEDDTEWVEEIEELLGAHVPESPRLRKITWMRYRIVGAAKDFGLVQDALERLSGTPEEAIVAAEGNFRGHARPS
uniref:Uncharacterized protein n=1 Tax=viral metagenome TaxID=1070528 RepID=A0A6M3J1G2_9ZZZZ